MVRFCSLIKFIMKTIIYSYNNQDNFPTVFLPKQPPQHLHIPLLLLGKFSNFTPLKNSSPLPPYFFTIIEKTLQLYSPQKNFTKNCLFPYNYWGTFLTCLLKDNPYQYLISSLRLFEKLTNFPPTKESLLIPPYFIKFNSETFRLSSWKKNNT